MTALLRYHAALLLRSQRWLPPFLLYAAFLAISVQAGQPVLDSLGYSAAALLPVAAWLARICVTDEPEAARGCVAAAVGPGRAHVACLLVALTGAVALGSVTTLLVTLLSDPVASDH
ncbi:ABC transporter, partial [Streptomyces violarus]|nr:ABC transporter [Streptomyces violarus]